ncbi:hypothetical protein PNOK_0174900 [Pyrrhoderma noxium]|uniref:SprT-like domain-containing protein n=1 Tax=Pyrrhoderma noxium TaxID=2282107 RepID=A0A286UQE0_9AGAM|nr:hypothetical protein PNOK_0174900 [Pyrrhoderma noxium]
MTQRVYEICGTSSDADGFSEIVSLQCTENKVTLPKDLVLAPERSQKTRSKPAKLMGQIIDINSSSDEDNPSNPKSPKGYAKRGSENEAESPISLKLRPGKVVRRNYRTIISDSEESTHDAINELGDSSANQFPVDEDSDNAVIVLNDPPKTRRPKKLQFTSTTQASKCSTGQQDDPINPEIEETVSLFKDTQFFSNKTESKDLKTISEIRTFTVSSTSEERERIPIKSRNGTKKRLTQKAIKEIEKQKEELLVEYAKNLFIELNASVFEGRLSENTDLQWNKRLQSTAGRAKWRRDNQGQETSIIELSTKVLDCEERIRNTLSHEMCHLASWVIDKRPKENHGDIWRKWVRRVMDKNPDIKISTKHRYDINYKYEWKCQTESCGKIYGRHSKSIDPRKSVCSVCNGGELKALFETRTRATSISTGKLISTKLRDAPVKVSRSTNVEMDTIIYIKSSSEDENGNHDESISVVYSRSPSPAVSDGSLERRHLETQEGDTSDEDEVDAITREIGSIDFEAKN